MKKTLLTFLIALMASLQIISAQDSEMKLYDGVPPGNIENSGIKEEYYNGKDQLSRVRNVTEPKLYFYKSQKKGIRPAVVICPGGGYAILSIQKEGDQIARWYTARGFHAFVLKYRIPNPKAQQEPSITPLMDAQAALKYVRTHAAEYDVKADKIGIMGFSAGGHLAATASNFFNNPVLEGATPDEVRPDFSVLCYPVITFTSPMQHKGSRINLIGKEASQETMKHFSMEYQVTDQTPPTFIIHAKDDTGVPCDNTNMYYDALVEHGVPSRKMLIEKGGHGFGMDRSNPAYGWQKELAKWLKGVKKGWK